jgi:hypothetical protein
MESGIVGCRKKRNSQQTSSRVPGMCRQLLDSYPNIPDFRLQSNVSLAATVASKCADCPLCSEQGRNLCWATSADSINPDLFSAFVERTI